MSSDSAAPAAGRQARAMTYKHNGSKYVVTVGEPRQVHSGRPGRAAATSRTLTGRAGGTPTGNTVTAIIDAGRYIEVHSEEPSQGWVNPLLAAYLSAHKTMINSSALCAALAVTERD